MRADTVRSGIVLCLILIGLLPISAQELSSKRALERRIFAALPEEMQTQKNVIRMREFYAPRLYGLDELPMDTWRRELERARFASDIGDPATQRLRWSQLGPDGILQTGFFSHWGRCSGRVRAVAVDPFNSNRVFIGAASGGLWRSLNGGGAWERVSDDFAVSTFGAVEIHPTRPDTVYAGTGEARFGFAGGMYDGRGLYRSFDGGDTWQQITAPFGTFTHFSGVDASPRFPNDVLVSLASGRDLVGNRANEGVWRSGDAGNTWTQVLDLNDAFQVNYHIDPTDVGRTDWAYAAIGGGHDSSGFYRSEDSGQTWTRKSDGLPNPLIIHRIQFSQSASSPGTFYAVVFTSGPLGTTVYKSTDSGDTWQWISIGVELGGNWTGFEWRDQGGYDLTIAVDPTDPDRVLLGNIELHQTTNGADFAPVRNFPFINGTMSPMHVDYHQIVFAPSNPNRIYVGNDGGIFRSTDGGDNWVNRNAGLNTIQYYRVAASPHNSDHFIGGAQDNGVYQSTNGGGSWTLTMSGDGQECFFDWNDPTTVFAATQNGTFYRSTNGGVDFQEIASQGTLDSSAAWTAPFMQHPTQANTLFAATSNIYVSFDRGTTWIRRNLVGPDSIANLRAIQTMDISPVTPANMAVAAQEFLYVSTDGGVTWTDRGTGVPDRWIGRVVFDPNDDQTLFAVLQRFNGSVVFRSTDLGVNWTNVTGNLPQVPANDLFVHPAIAGVWYLANDFGVYETLDGGVSWARQREGSFDDLPVVPAVDFAYQPQTNDLIVATHGLGAFRSPLPAIGVNFPAGGERLGLGQTVDITWRTVAGIGAVNIWLSTDGGAIWEPVASNTPNDGSHTWTLPTIGRYETDNALIRIVDAADPGVSGRSGAPFSIGAALAMETPAGGEEWWVDDFHTIIWNRFGSTGNVRLDYTRDGGNTWLNIVPSTDQISHTWRIPNTPGDDVRIRVMSLIDSTVQSTSNPFRIRRPEFVLTTPNGGESWYAGTPHDITWSNTGSVNTVLLEVSIYAQWQDIAVVSNTGSYTWTVPNLPTNYALVRVSAFQEVSTADTSDGFFSIPQSVLTRLDGDAIGASGGLSAGSAWGDYDNDGDEDLLVADFGNPNQLFRNNGGAGFTLIIPGFDPITTGRSDSRGATWGDYNNDGWLDVFMPTTPAYSRNNLLFRNLGNGQFTEITSGDIVNAGNTSQGASWADFDNDGWLDLFVANTLGQDNELYRNNGDGTFTRISSGPVVSDGGNSTGGYWGDYSGDGLPDLFVTNSSGQDNFLYRNRGDGQFTKISNLVPATDGGTSTGASWIDWDNDGDLDLFVTNYNQPNTLYRNDFGSSFTKITGGILVTDVESSEGAAWADYNNDGFLDVFVANYGANNTLYRNVGNGFFTRETNGGFATDGGNSTGAGWADYDRDGDLDLLVTNEDGENNFFYFNAEADNGNAWLHVALRGIYSNAAAIGATVRVYATLYGTPRELTRVVSGQSGGKAQSSLEAAFGLGNATTVDSLVVDWPAGNRTVMTGVSVNQRLEITETLTLPFTNLRQPLTGMSAAQARWLDMDNDGDVDLVMTGSDGDLSTHVYRNDGGNFVEVSTSLPVTTFGALAAGDFDGDGLVDLAIAGLGSGGARVTAIYRNTGSGWSDIGAPLVPVTRADMDWGDVDGDGDLDLAVLGQALENGAAVPVTRIYRNDGGQFADAGIALEDVYSGALLWCDFDLDGDLDLFLCGLNSFVVRVSNVYENDGGNLVDSGASLFGLATGDAAAADFSGDGYPDLVITGLNNSVAPDARLYRNNGGPASAAIGFTEVAAPLDGVYQASVAWADADLDGDPDLLISGRASNAGPLTRLYRNDGGTLLAGDPANLPQVNNGAVAWADLDGDNDPDLLVSGFDGGQQVAYLYQNNSDTPHNAPDVPEELFADVSGSRAVLNWDNLPTGMQPEDGTYNVRVGSVSGQSDVVPSHADPLTGTRRITAPGNAWNSLAMVLDSLPRGRYYWSVQAIDHALQPSPFAVEDTFEIGANRAPLARNDTLAVPEDVALTLPVLANDGDPDGDRLRVVRVDTAGTVGLATLAGDSVVAYRPARNYSGPDRFGYVVSDGLGGIDSATVFLDVVGANDPPVIDQLPLITFAEDDTLIYPVRLFYGFVSDPDHPDSLLDYRVGGGRFVAVDSSDTARVFRARADWFGEEVLRLTVSDGVLLDSADLRVRVVSVNDAPQWSLLPDSLVVAADSSANLDLPAFAEDVDHPDSLLVFDAASDRDSLSIAIDGDGLLTISPVSNWSGTARLTLGASDPDSARGVAEVVVRVNPLVALGKTLAGVPTRHTLAQNYPNPFNPSTVIRFGLPAAERVRLEVFTVLGQRVTVLVEGQREAGYHEVTFDASALASGMYVYRLTAGRFVAVRKMLLLR